MRNLKVVSSQFNYNFGEDAGYGIAMQDAIGCSLEHCQTDANMTDGVFLGRFIFDDLLSDNPNPVITDATILHCSAKENGNDGFDVDASSATIDNCLFQNNIALSNGDDGFFDSSDPFTNRYLNNYSKGNDDDNYDIVNGAIQIFSLDSVGNWHHISGDPTNLTSYSNVEG